MYLFPSKTRTATSQVEVCPTVFRAVVQCFEAMYSEINSQAKTLTSDGVLHFLRPQFEALGFTVETGKSKGEKIPVPVLFGLNNHIDKSFDAVALNFFLVTDWKRW